MYNTLQPPCIATACGLWINNIEGRFPAIWGKLSTLPISLYGKGNIFQGGDISQDWAPFFKALRLKHSFGGVSWNCLKSWSKFVFLADTEDVCHGVLVVISLFSLCEWKRHILWLLEEPRIIPHACLIFNRLEENQTGREFSVVLLFVFYSHWHSVLLKPSGNFKTILFIPPAVSK